MTWMLLTLTGVALWVMSDQHHRYCRRRWVDAQHQLEEPLDEGLRGLTIPSWDYDVMNNNKRKRR